MQRKERTLTAVSVLAAWLRWENFFLQSLENILCPPHFLPLPPTIPWTVSSAHPQQRALLRKSLLPNLSNEHLANFMAQPGSRWAPRRVYILEGHYSLPPANVIASYFPWESLFIMPSKQWVTRLQLVKGGHYNEAMPSHHTHAGRDGQWHFNVNQQRCFSQMCCDILLQGHGALTFILSHLLLSYFILVSINASS